MSRSRPPRPNPAWQERRAPTEIDSMVGRNIRRLRSERGLSQQGLASGLDVSYQQVQKYEQGRNRVSASVLFEIATFLDAPIADFFIAAPPFISGVRHFSFRTEEKTLEERTRDANV